MTSDLKLLIKEFRRISNKKWIPSMNMGTGSVGLTFENELKKNLDSMFFPDYNGIELKCTTRFSNFPFSLFSIAFDGPSYPEINRIVELYGYSDYKFYGNKVLYVDLNTCEKSKKGNYQFKLDIDEQEGKLFLEVYSLDDKLIERKSFVYIDNILERLNLKLKNLAVIHGSKKIINEEYYFRYYELDAYTLKQDVFLNLLKDGKITVSLESRIGKSGKFEGKYKNKNLVFKIKREYIEDLFTKIYSLNMDYNFSHYVKNKESGFYIMP